MEPEEKKKEMLQLTSTAQIVKKSLEITLKSDLLADILTLHLRSSHRPKFVYM